MTNDLRPIGSEFAHCSEPDRICSKQVWRVFTYRVVAHDRVVGGMAERVEATDIKVYPTGWMILGGSLVPVPPAEIRHLVPGWDRFTA